MIVDLYKMVLHEAVGVDDDWSAMRVPGGWIYIYWNSQLKPQQTVFVPYDNEFMSR